MNQNCDAYNISKPLRVVIFISGRGSNMQSLVQACQSTGFPAKVIAVLSNRLDAQGLTWAKSQGIKTIAIDHKNFDSKKMFEEEVLKSLVPYNFDLVCLAGFMRILSADFLEKIGCDVVNIHPSLLPLYKGLDTHERAIQDGQTQAGCTVHFVTAELDAGDVIAQKRVPILKDDTPETLAARVLEQEHILYPQAVRALAQRYKKH